MKSTRAAWRALSAGPLLGALLLLLGGPVGSLVLEGCGAKTGLTIPDSGMRERTDAAVCLPRPLVLTPETAEVLFVIDRSNSMADTLDGEDPLPGEPSRWDLLAQALETALADEDERLAIGANFFPQELPPDRVPIEEACMNDDDTVDLSPALGNAGRLLSFFASTDPRGGTPTTSAMEESRAFLAARAREGVNQYIVLATDGGPNCNPLLDQTTCTCAGPPDLCEPAEVGAYNCLDDLNAAAVVGTTFSRDGIPVYVVAIDDPGRPDLADALDRIAEAGGRPRTGPGRSFFSIRNPGDLTTALTTITSDIARCVFNLSMPPEQPDQTAVWIDDRSIPRDPSRTEGWDWTREDRSELTFFGEACAEASAPGSEVLARFGCL